MGSSSHVTNSFVRISQLYVKYVLVIQKFCLANFSDFAASEIGFRFEKTLDNPIVLLIPVVNTVGVSFVGVRYLKKLEHVIVFKSTNLYFVFQINRNILSSCFVFDSPRKCVKSYDSTHLYRTLSQQLFSQQSVKLIAFQVVHN